MNGYLNKTAALLEDLKMKMINKAIIYCSLLLLSFTSFAGMRCNGKLIRVGDLSYKVSKHCGAPTYLEVVPGPDGTLYKAFLVYERNGGTYVILIIDSRVRSVSFHRD